MFDFGESIWWLLVLLGVMIVIHELGHYWMARFFDVKVDAFSVGFGPRLFGFKVGETDFKFCAILFGGYVKMAGEIPGEESAAAAKDPRSFLAKPRWQRFMIALAGPLMNIILAIAIVTVLNMQHYERTPLKPSPTIGFVDPAGAMGKAGIREGDQIVQVDEIPNPTWKDIAIREFEDTNRTMSVVVLRNGERKTFEFPLPASDRTHIGDGGWLEERDILIGGFAVDSAAQKAGLKEGDKLVSANGQAIRSRAHLNRILSASPGKPVDLVYGRNGVDKSVTIQPALRTLEDGSQRWMIGITMDEALEVTQLSFPDALRESVRANYEGAGMVYKFLRGLIERRLSPKSLEGPVGIARLAKSAAHQGVWTFLSLMAMVSLQLAIFNLLPIPVLDGGLMLMLLVEMIRRQDLSMKFKEAVLKVGFAFLMMVAVFVLYNDITKPSRTVVPTAAPEQPQTQQPAPATPQTSR